MYFFLYFSFFLYFFSLYSQKGKRSFVNRLRREQHTNGKWKIKTNKSFFSRHPSKNRKNSFFFGLFFWKCETAKESNHLSFILHRNVFLPVSFSSDDIYFRVYYTRSSTPRCQFHPVVSSSCVKSELALIINQYHKQTTITYIEKINTLHAL